MKEKELPSDGRWLEYIQELVNDEWHQSGYMKAKVELQLAGSNVKGKLTEVVLIAKVRQGLQYRLGQISFKGGTQFTNDQLRAAFPSKDNALFNVEEFRKGLENLRFMYGERGYVSFTSIPDLVFDDESRRISVAIELDEHIQYFISDVTFLGVTPEQERLLRQDEAFLPGAPFNASLIECIAERYSSLPKLQNLLEQMRIRQHSDGRMSLLLDFRPCPTAPDDWEGRDSEARPELRRTAKD